MQLFQGEPISVPLQNAKATYFPNFLSENEHQLFLKQLVNECNWVQNNIKLFGKVYLEPRLVCWQSTFSYGYSGITLPACNFSPTVQLLLNQVESFSGYKFNGVLINYYRNGNDSMGWHADDELNLGSNPIIASLNLGQSRTFHFKHKTEKGSTVKILLEGGSLLLMEENSQLNYLHQVPKSKTQNGSRINLTFRKIIS